MTVWRVVGSWGNVLGVCVLFFVVLFFGKVDAELRSLVIEGTSKLFRSFHEGVVEGFIVMLNLFLAILLGNFDRARDFGGKKKLLQCFV